jgi:organic radical activating enzyme
MTNKSCHLKGNQKSFYLHLNRAASCCRAESVELDTTKPITFYTDMWQQESQLLDQGDMINSCQICWKDEADNKLSYRQTHQKSSYRAIELFLNNACNHMCSYCSPKFSSTWEDSIKTFGPFKGISGTSQANLALVEPSTTSDHWVRQLETYISTQPDNSVNVKLLGGEPLMQQRSLERLLQMSNSKIEKLYIHTNLNPPSNKFLLWLLDNFPIEKLRIDISIDASVDYNHIVRAGFHAENFLQNFQLLREHRVNYTIASVVSVLSIFDLANFVKWNTQLGHTVDTIQLNNPQCLDPILVPYDIRQDILRSLSTPDALIVDILNDTAPLDHLRLVEQYNYLTEYFKRATIHTDTIDNAVFQQWWAWLAQEVKQ